MGVAAQLIGERFGRLKVLSREPNNIRNGVVWLCLCDCGNFTEITTGCLNSGNSTSCGCKRKDTMREILTIHGGRDDPEYIIWKGMHQRCYNPNTSNYFYYGARGIQVDPEWHDYARFKKDLNSFGARLPGDTLDRIDNSKNYGPTNCKWSDKIEQANNRRHRSCKKLRDLIYK